VGIVVLGIVVLGIVVLGIVAAPVFVDICRILLGRGDARERPGYSGPAEFGT
jgi:hypothetical protein